MRERRGGLEGGREAWTKAESKDGEGREREGGGGEADVVREAAVRRLGASGAGCLLIGKQRAVGGQIRVTVG